MSRSIDFCREFSQTFALSQTNIVVDVTEGLSCTQLNDPGMFATMCAATLSNVLNIKKRVKK
jgi:hypothetical protein